jgi:hypothetical protein
LGSNKLRLDNVLVAQTDVIFLECDLKFLLAVLLFGFVGCANGAPATITEPSSCVETSPAPAAEEKTCDDENTVAQKVEALRARHVSGELNDDELYAEQGAIIDGACFKAYLPVVEDDLSPMGPGPATRLRKLKSLFDAGIVDEAEYQTKKRQILEVL